jgi:Cdc6-like AAA superfamily ATPase
LLLLIECEPLGPADYRDLLFSYKKAKDAISRIETFLGPILHEKKQTERYQYQEQRKKRDVEELAMLRIGEPIAEHEEDGLIESAFIETAAYHAALNSSQNVFVGRKGVGKTANFKKLSKVLAQDKRNLVCEIKPLSYELEALLAVAKRFELISKKGFLFESLWKFLIYSEIAKQVAQAIEARVSGEIFANETKLMKLLADNSALLSLDFAARLDTLSKSLLDSSLEDSQAPDATFAVSELLHSGIIKELVDSLSQALNNKNRIVVLIDNLDKAWDKSENTRFLSYFFLGLLSALRRIANDFKNRPMGKDVIQLSLCLFVRTDIFDIVLEQAREPDKIQHQRLSWDDRDRLRMLADYRLVAAAGAGEINIQPEKIWKRFFATTISGKELFDYIFSVILMRPRDLLFFLRSAISAAVSRRHDLVREDDFLRAEDDYSNFAFQSMLVELRDKLPEIEEILAEFMGSYAVLTELDIRESILKDDSRSELDFNSIIAGLTLSSFFEIEVPTKGFVGVSDERDYLRLYRAASNLSARDKMPIRFRIHRAFWKALLVVDAGEAQ